LFIFPTTPSDCQINKKKGFKIAKKGRGNLTRENQRTNRAFLFSKKNFFSKIINETIVKELQIY